MGSLSLPYLAFVEALRSYALERDPDGLRQDLGTGAAEVARIVSEVRERVQVEPMPPGDPEDDRYRLLQAVAEFLRNASAVQPLLIVLEDLHDADRGTLDMLTHAARSMAGARLMIVGTYRDIEVDRAHPLSAALAELRRAASFERVALRGLSVDEVQRMMSNLAGHDTQWSSAQAIYRQTEGNPLFVLEVIRYLIEEGEIVREDGQSRSVVDLADRIPEGLRDVIGRRMERLGDDTNRVLGIASVIGREFRVDTLETISGLPEENVLSAIEDAVRVAVLQEMNSTGAVSYRFAHAFFRQTLYAEIIAPRRIRLHQQVARALQETYANRLEEHAAELADHYSYSSDTEDLARAIQFGEVAAARAMSVHAYGEAARLLSRAIEVQELVDPDDASKLCDLLMALGEATLPTGDPNEIIEGIAPRAFALAERLGGGARAAQVARMALIGLFRRDRGAFPFGSDLYREWAARGDQHAPAGTVDRAYADARMSNVLISHGDYVGARERYKRAVTLARELGDAAAFLTATVSGAAMRQPEHANEHLDTAEEVARSPRGGLNPGTWGTAMTHAAGTFLMHGDRQRADEVVAQIKGLAELSRDELLIGQAVAYAAVDAYLDGRLEEVIAAKVDRVFAQRMKFPALLALGHTEEAFEEIQPFNPEGSPLSRSYLALEAAFRGHLDEAARLLDEEIGETLGAERPFRQLSALLETAIMTNNQRALRLLTNRLREAGGLVDVGVGEPGSLIGRHLGAGVALLGEIERARSYYNQALEVGNKVRFRPEVALTRLQLAELLLEHYPDERAEAIAHLDFAIAELRDMKMQPALERALSHREILKA